MRDSKRETGSERDRARASERKRKRERGREKEGREGRREGGREGGRERERERERPLGRAEPALRSSVRALQVHSPATTGLVESLALCYGGLVQKVIWHALVL